jgi:hypothetical protein
LDGEAHVEYAGFVDGAGAGRIGDRIFRSGVPEIRRVGAAQDLVEHSVQLETGGRRGGLPAIFRVLCQGHIERRVVGAVSDGVARLRVHTAVVASIFSREIDEDQVHGRRIDPARHSVYELRKQVAS